MNPMNQMKKKVIRIPNIHPGEVLLEDILKPMQISQYRLAKSINVTQSTISDIMHGKRGITAEIALRLGRYFDLTPQFWLNLQEMYDLEETGRALGKEIEKI